MSDPTSTAATGIPTSSAVNLIELAAGVTAAFLEHQRIDSDAVPALIVSIHDALTRLAASSTPVEADAEAVPAAVTRGISLRKSLADPDWIVSMIDGKRYRALKRHLGSHGLSPDQYRTRYGLPSTYPMVAPGYAAARSATAKKLGFGRKKTIAPTTDTAPADPALGTPKRRGRPRKAPA